MNKSKTKISPAPQPAPPAEPPEGETLQELHKERPLVTEEEKATEEEEVNHRRQLRRRELPEETKETRAQNALAKLEERLDRCKIRVDPLGLDRHRNAYYWFPSLPECLSVIDPEHSTIRSPPTEALSDAGVDVDVLEAKRN